MKTFKQFSEKGYKHHTENTIEELDKLPLDSTDIITEFAHLCEWLRVNHGIWISVKTLFDHEIYGKKDKWEYDITNLNNAAFYPNSLEFNSPQ